MTKLQTPDRTFVSGKGRTPSYERAVETLKELLAETNADTVERAFAEAVYLARWVATAERLKAQQRPMSACLERLMGARHCRERGSRALLGEFQGCETYSLPARDHTQGYVRDRKVAAIVSEPYHLSFEQMRELVEFCEQRGLRADVDAASAHFPSRTLRIIVRREGEQESWLH